MEKQRGICRLSIVPVRGEGRESSEMVTQLLFGDHYSVHEADKSGDWLRIMIHFDEYEGWINRKQHFPISEEYFEELSSQEYRACGEICGRLQLRDEYLNIVFGSLLPITSNELFDVSDQLNFQGKTVQVRKTRDFGVLKELAFQYINSPYLWGGKTPFGIDCSGFVQMIYKLGGYSLKRDASQQAQQGKVVQTLAESKPGDLAFFHNAAGKIVHVGMVLEDKKIIHASGKVRVDDLDDQGIYIQENEMYTHRLCLIKRMIV